MTSIMGGVYQGQSIEELAREVSIKLADINSGVMMETETVTREIETTEDKMGRLKGVLLLIVEHLIEGDLFANQISERPQTTANWLFEDIGFCIGMAESILEQANQLGYKCNQKQEVD